MDPLTAQALAEAHIADLHRQAARYRRTRQATTGASSSATRRAWSAARTATAAWVTGRTSALSTHREPACCTC